MEETVEGKKTGMIPLRAAEAVRILKRRLLKEQNTEVQYNHDPESGWFRKGGT